MIRVCIAGVTGWIGKPLAEAIQSSDDLKLVAAVARRAVGESIGDVTISGSIDEALMIASDVFVDYTSAEAVKSNVLAAVHARRHVVVGSSGLSDADYSDIDLAARERDVGVIAVGNFAISAALLQRFAVEAAKHMPSWEIIDYAHDSKVDAPSGTARELAWRMQEAGEPQRKVAIEDTVGDRGARGARISTSQVHSLRLPGQTIGVEVLLGREDERLTIRYEGGPGAEPYLQGTLLAIRRVAEFRGVVRGLDRLL